MKLEPYVQARQSRHHLPMPGTSSMDPQKKLSRYSDRNAEPSHVVSVSVCVTVKHAVCLKTQKKKLLSSSEPLQCRTPIGECCCSSPRQVVSAVPVNDEPFNRAPLVSSFRDLTDAIVSTTTSASGRLPMSKVLAALPRPYKSLSLYLSSGCYVPLRVAVISFGNDPTLEDHVQMFRIMGMSRSTPRVKRTTRFKLICPLDVRMPMMRYGKALEGAYGVRCRICFGIGSYAPLDHDIVLDIAFMLATGYRHFTGVTVQQTENEKICIHMAVTFHWKETLGSNHVDATPPRALSPEKQRYKQPHRHLPLTAKHNNNWSTTGPALPDALSLRVKKLEGVVFNGLPVCRIRFDANENAVEVVSTTLSQKTNIAFPAEVLIPCRNDTVLFKFLDRHESMTDATIATAELVLSNFMNTGDRLFRGPIPVVNLRNPERLACAYVSLTFLDWESSKGQVFVQ